MRLTRRIDGKPRRLRYLVVYRNGVALQVVAIRLIGYLKVERILAGIYRILAQRDRRNGRVVLEGCQLTNGLDSQREGMSKSLHGTCRVRIHAVEGHDSDSVLADIA